MLVYIVFEILILTYSDFNHCNSIIFNAAVLLVWFSISYLKWNYRSKNVHSHKLYSFRIVASEIKMIRFQCYKHPKNVPKNNRFFCTKIKIKCKQWWWIHFLAKRKKGKNRFCCIKIKIKSKQWWWTHFLTKRKKDKLF